MEDIEDLNQLTPLQQKNLFSFLQKVSDDGSNFNSLRREFSLANKCMPTKNQMLNAWRSNDHEINPFLNAHLIVKKGRSLSGVLVVAVFTHAHPSYVDETGKTVTQTFSCKHSCAYCPLEPAHEGNGFVEQPRSYLLQEPGVLRANKVGFVTVKQVWIRLETYYVNGHPLDKLEIIVLGGTWTEYPVPYQRQYIRDVYYAVNVFDPLKTCEKQKEQAREPMTMEEEISENDLRSPIKIIGLTLETRPDTINLEEIKRMRSYGCTRVQIGVQHTNNDILRKVQRGHTIEDTMAAIELLKDCGLKVDIHLMPNLPSSTVEMDRAMFNEVLTNPMLQADEFKLYPCSVVPWTLIETWFKEGSYVPYPDSELFQLLIEVKKRVHPYIRIARLVRDIPESYISGGCKNSNMRQLISLTPVCRCIRCRQCNDKKPVDMSTLELIVRSYPASNGTEYFISVENVTTDTIYGFLRLRVTNKSGHNMVTLDSIRECALIRELHVYGQVVAHDQEKKTNTSVQHSGIGKSLMAKAEEIARVEGYTKIVVISGIGVRGYYRRLGYNLTHDDGYMIKSLLL